MAKIRITEPHLGFKCLGCKEEHFFNRTWQFNDNLNSPTVRPSILVRHFTIPSVCHSFITDGKIQYLADCTHELANQTVDLPDYECNDYTSEA